MCMQFNLVSLSNSVVMVIRCIIQPSVNIFK